jgi:hypothetical protein
MFLKIDPIKVQKYQYENCNKIMQSYYSLYLVEAYSNEKIILLLMTILRLGYQAYCQICFRIILIDPIRAY